VQSQQPGENPLHAGCSEVNIPIDCERSELSSLKNIRIFRDERKKLLYNSNGGRKKW